MGDPQWGPVEKNPPGALARPDKNKPPRTPAQRRAILALKGLGISLALVLVAGFAVVFIGYTTTDRPDPNADFQTATTGVYFNDGTTRLGRFEVQNRTPLKFDQMPDTMKQAIVAAENRTFWTDKGISIRGMLRAGWAIARGEDLQGGSTITQQYIKILYLDSERTVTRKFREIFLAYKISKELSKEEILEDYLNTIYFGHGAYGLQAASRAYFGTHRRQAHRAPGRVPVHRGQQPDRVRPRRRGQPRPHPGALPLRDLVHARDGLHHRRRGRQVPAGACPSSPSAPPATASAAPRASCSRWSSGS